MDIKIINPIPQEDINFILNIYENGLLPYELECIGEGCQAEVFRYKNYAIKTYNDGHILEKLQDNDLFPKLYFYTDDFMVTEYLEITDAYDYFERNVDIWTDAFEVFRYCLSKSLIPYDIHDSNVVVTSDDKLKIIDVGSFVTYGNLYNLDRAIEKYKNDYIELDNIINHVRRPPIAI